MKGEKRRKRAPVSVIPPEGGWAVQAHVPGSGEWPRCSGHAADGSVLRRGGDGSVSVVAQENDKDAGRM